MTPSLPVPPSLWWSGETRSFPTLDTQLEADVAIIGGGITGVTLAYWLALRDARIAVLDQDRIAGAASGATPASSWPAPPSRTRS
jgi:NADPH-dependent 2,4-dienoyl-CoA reductase/sulfur reductase-like enzyme